MENKTYKYSIKNGGAWETVSGIPDRFRLRRVFTAAGTFIRVYIDGEPKPGERRPEVTREGAEADARIILSRWPRIDDMRITYKAGRPSFYTVSDRHPGDAVSLRRIFRELSRPALFSEEEIEPIREMASKIFFNKQNQD
jgi:hypothetical protein